MDSFQPNQGTKAGMIGGLLFVFIGLSMGEIVKTAMLAAIGAGVSYGVTVAIKWIERRMKGKG
jgi:hypothetical protein